MLLTKIDGIVSEFAVLCQFLDTHRVILFRFCYRNFLMSNNNVSNSTASTPEGSYIPADQKLPEITIKAVILSIILTITLTAANAYLGLKVGTTISASIPAAVISMGILRMFRKSNILENNIVQTAASAGEALVAGVAFILPSLIIMHHWQNFNYWETATIAMSGGILGVLFSVPLRRVLLAEKTLKFPEGTAIGNVLKASAESAAGLKNLVWGGLVGGLISLCQAGFKVVSDSVDIWFQSGSSVYGIGFGFNPALIAAGYIVGFNVALSILLGVICGWVVGVPVLTHHFGITQPTDAGGTAMDMWHQHIRYMGVGTMLVGGFWTLLNLVRPIIEGVRSSFASVRMIQAGSAAEIPRTERDLPINYIIWAAILIAIPLAIIFAHFTNPAVLNITPELRIGTIIVIIIFTVIFGFIFASICGYFTGLVGSTNNPLSGMTLSALLLMSLLIMTLLGHQIQFSANHVAAISAAALAIIASTVVASAAAITNDTIQDLKAGNMVGATPWKQQVMLIIGTIVAALVIPPILQLLYQAYGISGVFPHPGMDPKQMLSAPQAALMGTLVQGVFAHNLPWTMIGIGALIAAFCIVIDTAIKDYGYRLPVLAVGLGIYLPLDASMPLVIGGVATLIIDIALKKRYPEATSVNHEPVRAAHQRGLILACGVVAGAALMGVILAIPFAIAQSDTVLKLVGDAFTPVANILGVVVTAALVYWIYRVVCGGKAK